MELDVREISSIAFGLYSPDEILDISCCKIDNSKRAGPGTVYDPRMGTTDETVCETCHESAEICPGHFGHIELNEPILHPLYYKEIVNFLKCVCIKCWRLLILPEQIELDGLSRIKGPSRFVKILEKISKTVVCCHDDCNTEQPDVKFIANEEVVSLCYTCPDKTKTSIILASEEILKILNHLTDDDVKLLGFDPALVHPRNLIFVNYPVMPPACRPYVKKDGAILDDDFTNQMVEIVKANNKLAEPDLPDASRQKAIQTIKFRISTTFNNSKGRAKHTANGRPIKSIKSRISGKEGQVRGAIQGKRTEQSGRTVIGPDPLLRMGEIALPYDMANILTTPERITKFNQHVIQKLVNEGQVDSIIAPDGKTKINLKRFRRGTVLIPGDVIIRGDQQITVTTGRELVIGDDTVLRNGEPLEHIKPSNRHYPVKIGWIAERKLRTGDTVLANRQPTLHKGSMVAMKIVVRKNHALPNAGNRGRSQEVKTLRMNLAICGQMNADFDGDEMDQLSV